VPPTPPGPDGKPPLKVVVVGDSMADGLAGGLAEWATARGNVVVYNLAIRGCPITRLGTRRFPDDTPWPVTDQCEWWSDSSSERSMNFNNFNPDLVVMQDGMNNVPDRKIPAWSDFKHTGQAQFDDWLLNEYATATKTFSAHHAKILFLNTVCANWDVVGTAWAGYDNGDGDSRVASLQRDDQAVATDNATIGDLNTHLCPKGKFSDSVDGVSDARPDGYHLSDDAALAVAQKWLGPLVLNTTRTPSVTAP
jgi:hypothetical protein